MSANTDSSHTIKYLDSAKLLLLLQVTAESFIIMALHQLKSQQLFLSPAYRICSIVSSVIFISSINIFFFKPIIIFIFFYVKLRRIIVSRLKFPPVISVQHGQLILIGVIRISSLSLTSDCLRNLVYGI